MRFETFAAAAAAGKTLICESYQRMSDPEVVTGIATVVDETAHVKTADGTLKNAGRWPSHAHMFTPEGYRIHGAVVYNKPAKTADAIAALKPTPTPDVIVNSLADEIENHRFDKGWLEIVAQLEGRIPELSSHPRVIKERAKNAARIEAERQTAETLRTDEKTRIDGMTAVAAGDCTPLETAALRTLIGNAVETAADGTAKLVSTVAHGRLPMLNARANEQALRAIERLDGIAVPIGADRHATLARHVRVRWQESPDEADVSGIIHTARGKTIDTSTAGKRNARIIRRIRARQTAREKLDELLTETVPESDGVPPGSIEIEAARRISTGGYGTRWFITPDHRIVRTRSEHDWPTRITASAKAVAVITITKGLQIAKTDIPERHIHLPG